MSIVAILIDTKNPTEVLGCYGILALDFLLDKQITRSRFVESMKLEPGKDGKLRSGVFELEHPDFAGFLNQCRDMQLTVSEGAVSIESNGRVVLTLDWYLRMFVGDAGNFSQADKLEVIHTHHRVLCDAIDTDSRDLFSTAVEAGVPNRLSSYSSRKKNYRNAGGVYKTENVFYASEWFLLVALQCYRHFFEKHLRSRECLRYSVFADWLPTNAAFAGIAGGHQSCKHFESNREQFGRYGTVLSTAQEVG
jgi:hypothetical protein